MKAVLFALNSSYIHTNLAVRCIKNYVEYKLPGKHEIIILERNLKDKSDEVLYALYSMKAQVYAFSCYIFNIREMISYASNLKSLLPESKIIFGGPEVSYDAEKLLNSNPFIDNVILNEGEEVFVNYLEEINHDKIIDGQIFKDFSKQGIQYRAGESMTGNIAYYESSRGCPYKCSYCLSSLRVGIRSKTALSTLKDLIEFERYSNITIIKFVDRTFNYDIKRANEILKGLLDEKYTKIYHIEIRPELFDDEMFDILRKFPKNKLQMEIGIQTTNDKTLNAIDRPSDIKKTICNMEKLRNLKNIKIHADLIAGLPYDDLSSFKKSFNDIFYVCDELQLGFLKLLKGSKIRKQQNIFSYKYNYEAPYDIFENDFLSFDEIYKLKRIAALTDRYKNSLHFIECLDFITRYFSSPFDFFAGLDEFINYHISAISQHEAFKVLFEYSKIHIKVNMNDDEWLNFIKYLRADYFRCLNREAPKYFA